MSCGVGRRVLDIDHLPRSLADARFAAEQLRARLGEETPDWTSLAYEELDLATALVCDGDPEVLEARGEALLQRVGGAELHETLLAYLDHDLDIPRTAAFLHLHANSLRYRLSRIEEQLGMPLRHPGTIANLYLAVLARRSSNGIPRRGNGG